MTMQQWIGAALLACGAALGAYMIWDALRNRKTFFSERGNLPLLCALEVAIYFCATLGISDFLLNTLTVRKFRLTEDEKLPGTLIAAGLTPGGVIAFFLLQVENPVEIVTLVLCAASITLGCVLGARLVGKIEGAKIKRVMGFALIGSMIALILKMIVSAGATGEATGLTLRQLWIAVPFSVFWGAVNMIGVPMKPAGTAFFLIMGMSPLSALTLVLVMACMGPMGGAISVLKRGAYHRKLSCAGCVFGAVGAVCGSLFAISVNALLLNILLLGVMLIAIVSMFRD